MEFHGCFLNDKTKTSKFVWYIIPSDPDEEEYDPIAGFSTTTENALDEARKYIDAYNCASIKITTLTGKTVVEP